MTNVFDQMATRDGDTNDSKAARKSDDLPEQSPASTSSDVKQITQELLKHGFVEESQKADLFRQAIVRQQDVTAALEPLDLELRLDTHRGIAFLKVAESAYGTTDDAVAWKHPLVRRQRLTLEQSLLIAILRQAFVMHEQESGVGQSSAKIAVDELLPHFLTYFEDSGSDAKNESRLLNLLDQLKSYGIVSEVDKKHEVTIRPLIAHLASPESLKALLQSLQEQSVTDGAAGGES
jgi:hypothetical protein